MADELAVDRPEPELRYHGGQRMDLDEMLEYEEERRLVNLKAIGQEKPRGVSEVGVV